jgi:flagellar secretion chaperone FliS
MSSQHDQYRMTSIQTAPPDQLLLMLYDGAIRFLEQAKTAIEERRNPAVPISRAQDIILELVNCLDMKAGEISLNLAQLYEYFLRRLLHAQIHHDQAALDEVATHLRGLREAWAAAAVEARKQKRLTARAQAAAPAGG